jgi:hypothetical protein
MSKVTPLASSQINVSDTLTVELLEADEPRPSSSAVGPLKRPSCIRGASLTLPLRL